MSLKITFYRALYEFGRLTGKTFLDGSPQELDVVVSENTAKLQGIKEVELHKIQEIELALASLKKEYETDFKLLQRLRSELERAEGKQGSDVFRKYLRLIEQKDSNTQSAKKELIRKIKSL